jgi:3'-5' exoribonuclease
MPRIPVAQLKLNLILTKQIYLLREKSQNTTRIGSPMLRLTVADRSGSIPGVFFDVPNHVFDSLVVGQGVEVSGRVGEFKEQLQITVERIVPVQLRDLTDFLPASRRPLAEMVDELEALRAGIENAHLTRLLDALFADAELAQGFRQAPAAKAYHHACLGGLLEHTLAVVRLVITACDLYPELDRDLAITVALLHDLGKVQTYDPTSFEMTRDGALLSHLYLGAARVEAAIASLPGFDAELHRRVVHAILAHHGTMAHGSPVVPATLEAIVLHYADNLDGDARGALDFMERGEESGALFTDFSTMHDSRLYRGESAATRHAPPQSELPW